MAIPSFSSLQGMKFSTFSIFSQRPSLLLLRSEVNTRSFLPKCLESFVWAVWRPDTEIFFKVDIKSIKLFSLNWISLISLHYPDQSTLIACHRMRNEMVVLATIASLIVLTKSTLAIYITGRELYKIIIWSLQVVPLVSWHNIFCQIRIQRCY